MIGAADKRALAPVLILFYLAPLVIASHVEGILLYLVTLLAWSVVRRRRGPLPAWFRVLCILLRVAGFALCLRAPVPPALLWGWLALHVPFMRVPSLRDEVFWASAACALACATSGALALALPSPEAPVLLGWRHDAPPLLWFGLAAAILVFTTASNEHRPSHPARASSGWRVVTVICLLSVFVHGFRQAPETYVHAWTEHALTSGTPNTAEAERLLRAGWQGHGETWLFEALRADACGPTPEHVWSALKDKPHLLRSPAVARGVVGPTLDILRMRDNPTSLMYALREAPHAALAQLDPRLAQSALDALGPLVAKLHSRKTPLRAAAARPTHREGCPEDTPWHR